MPAGLGALGDDNVSAFYDRILRHCFGLHLANEERTGGLDPFNEGSRVTERQPHSIRSYRQGPLKKLGLPGEVPCNETDAEWHGPRALCLLQKRQFPPEPICVAIANAQYSETARIGNGKRQLSVCNQVHCCQQYRKPDAQQLIQRGVDRHLGWLAAKLTWTDSEVDLDR